MIISASYVSGMALSDPALASWTQSPLNPAIALSMLSMATFAGHINEMHWSWIFITFAWVGALLALLCFEYVFKKAFDTVEKRDDEEEIIHEEEHNEIAQPLME